MRWLKQQVNLLVYSWTLITIKKVMKNIFKKWNINEQQKGKESEKDEKCSTRFLHRRDKSLLGPDIRFE